MTAREKAMIITKITEWLEREPHADNEPPATAAPEPIMRRSFLRSKNVPLSLKAYRNIPSGSLQSKVSFRAFAPARAGAAKF